MNARNVQTALRVEASERSLLLAKYGHELAPAMRVWASTAPIGALRVLFASADKVAASANRGGLQGRDLEELRQKLGTANLHTPEAERTPHINEAGHLVLPTMTPTEARKRLGGGK